MQLAPSKKIRRAYRPLAEINVTPFVDVMLILLIVFMVTAPMLTAGVELDLPDSEAAPINQEDSKLVEISVNAQGQLFVGETEVTEDKLLDVLATTLEGNDPSQRIYVRGDRTISYGRIMEIITLVSNAGYTSVALLTEPQ